MIRRYSVVQFVCLERWPFFQFLRDIGLYVDNSEIAFISDLDRRGKYILLSMA